MTYRVHQVNKKTGVTYVYEATATWDKEKKQPRNKQVCIGKIDPVTGEFVPSKRLVNKPTNDSAVTATAKIVGPKLLLDKVNEEIGLEKVLKNCFPTDYRQIMTMAHYLVSRGGALSHCDRWSSNHANPLDETLATQRITEILGRITEDGMQTFFDKWTRKVLEKDYLCYDITSISSYSELNEYIKAGYNRDGEKLRQVNLAMLFGQKSRLPVYYRRLPGNITDVSTLRNFLRTFKFLELPKLHLVMDKGFYSQANVDALFEAKDKFTLAVPNRAKWVRDAIDEVRDIIQNPDGYRKLEGEILYTRTKLMSWGENKRRCYLHLYYNSRAAAEEVDSFTEELIALKEELESGCLVAGHEEAYKTFFTIKETPIRGRKVSFNDEEIQKHRNRYAGFYAILTNDIKDPVQTLIVYRDKDAVEKSFDDLKNQLDMKRLRVHGSGTMSGRFFVQFIALIYMSALRQRMRESGLIDKYTVRELLNEMEPLTRIDYSGKYGHILTEVSKAQRLILEKMGIEIKA